MPAKLGRTSEQRNAMLRNQASELLWYGKIETTAAKAKALQPYVEKIITKAMSVYDLNEETTVTVKDSKGKDVSKKVIKDSPKKLAVRRRLMGKLRDLQEVKGFSEKKSEYKARTKDIQHPLMEKLFNEIAPKYAQRKEELGQG
ncbi:MAG: bL17 family ribosomal protein, partial [Candidatus Coproplasma sp.]